MPTGQALLNLADIANSVSGDLHTMHLNFHGLEFDMMHKEVLKTYYEEAAEDYDSWSELALMFDDVQFVENQNESAKRIEWRSYEGDVTREKAVARSEEIITAYMEAAVMLFNSVNNLVNADCKSIGVANALQTRIEFWSKELHYFNKRRVA